MISVLFCSLLGAVLKPEKFFLRLFEKFRDSIVKTIPFTWIREYD